MPNPTAGDVHVNQPLTNLSIAYAQDESEFVAGQIFPTVPVAKQSDVYYEYPVGTFMKNNMQERAPGTESAGDGWTVSNNPYNCRVFALHKDIADQIRANADSVFNLDADATRFLTSQALLNREVTFAANFMTSGAWGTTITGVASAPSGGQVLQWNDANSNPIENIRAGKLAIKQTTGKRANTLALSEPVWNVLVDHPDFLERVKGAASPSSPAIVLRQALASILEIDRVLVMGAVLNSANENQAASINFVAGKKALLLHTASAPSLLTPSAGYTFAWNGYLGGSSPVAIKRFRMEHLESDRVEIAAAYDMKKTGTALGFFWDSIIA